MPAFIDLTGQLFGDLTVLSRGANYSNGKVRWKCLCVCGEIRLYGASALRDGRIKSCGCRKRRTGNSHPLFKGIGEIPMSRWQTVESGAKIRNLEFSISIQEAWQLFLDQDRRCALTGVLLHFGTSQDASLDRIDNSKGYITGNVWWIHKTVNRLKWDMSTEDFIKWCTLVSDYQRKFQEIYVCTD